MLTERYKGIYIFNGNLFPISDYLIAVIMSKIGLKWGNARFIISKKL